jgi:flagellar motor switch protein FliG
MAAMGPVRLRDVDAAQQEIIALARNLERQNRISLSRSGQDEAYVQ